MKKRAAWVCEDHHSLFLEIRLILLNAGFRFIGNNGALFHPALDVGVVSNAVPIVLAFENFDLFGEGPDEIKLLLTASTRSYLQKMGFSLSVPLQLARQSLSGTAGQAWLLAPTEIVVR